VGQGAAPSEALSPSVSIQLSRLIPATTGASAKKRYLVWRILALRVVWVRRNQGGETVGLARLGGSCAIRRIFWCGGHRKPLETRPGAYRRHRDRKRLHQHGRNRGIEHRPRVLEM